MATQVQQWKSDDGSTHETEIEALRADYQYWRHKAMLAEGQLARINEKKESHVDHLKRSSYGSSGGGGHD